MTTVKEQARQVLDRLPDDCTFDDVQYELYVAETLKKRIAQADAGEFVSHEEVKRRLEPWLTK